jgi:hypothetical protein
LSVQRIKRGDFVKVYQDPFTQEKYEGIGRVIGVVQQDSETARVAVEFRDDEGEYERTVVQPAEIVQGWPTEGRAAK